MTKEELELLKTPSSELAKRARIASFDLHRFVRRVKAGDAWQQLLQAHLYLDHVITLTVAEALTNPDAIQLKRLGFSQKLQMIHALNLLRPDLVPPVSFVNGVRNKIAHDLDFEISEKQVLDLANCTPQPLRDVLLSRTREPGPLQLSELLFILVVHVDGERQERALQRLEYRKSQVQLRAALDDYDAVVREQAASSRA